MISFVDDRDGCLFIATVHRSELSASSKRSEKTEEVILHLLRENPKMTIKELSDAIGIASRNIEMQLSKLKKSKKIERIGPDKGDYWKVND
ncbi:winged helix-turn-helix transcriptional regulator [Candidatus Berkiella cookevillensis]|uniref:Winged helix-turn-helix transcriptional regulator n=1 Tax=Candidatus Berkiella cookevillensis TaxID=437022 RepID=A0A0Q9YA00_9GAMM|nr:winged helix-turn-helix transcriptional regulator [Candidatus Berkiella cookevillensis]MCS5707953.1 winged helix-turn-helix transcriptional regulator [Candidatus Berkiella cookevillensis]